MTSIAIRKRNESHLLASCLAVFFGAAAVSLPSLSLAEQGLKNCADSFADKSVQKAPKRSAGGQDTVFLCQRSGDTVFFALEYDPQKYAPLWVANRITDTFGPKGCASKTRDEMACYFKKKSAACGRNEKAGDPFHTDPDLLKADIQRLGPRAFGATGHDRGHMAPSSTFSWHICGNYKTYTMANMSAQWGPLNRKLWAELEHQTLYWGVKQGPVYVVTGPMWAEFPSDEFKVITDGKASTASFPKAGSLLKKKGGKKLTLDIPRPTGFYKVIYQSAGNGEPARAIAFLVPHTKQTGLSFWDFATTVSLVEQSTGLTFAIESGLKSTSPDLDYWQAESRQAPGGWSPGGQCPKSEKVAIGGWDTALSLDERVSLCRSERPAP